MNLLSRSSSEIEFLVGFVVSVVAIVVSVVVVGVSVVVVGIGVHSGTPRTRAPSMKGSWSSSSVMLQMFEVPQAPTLVTPKGVMASAVKQVSSAPLHWTSEDKVEVFKFVPGHIFPLLASIAGNVRTSLLHASVSQQVAFVRLKAPPVLALMIGS